MPTLKSLAFQINPAVANSIWDSFPLANPPFNVGSRIAMLPHALRSVRAERTDSGAVYSFDLPGIAPQQIDLLVQHNEVAITYPLGDVLVSKSIPLDSDLDLASAEASWYLGVLEIRFNTLLPQEGKKIPISIVNYSESISSVTEGALSTSRDMPATDVSAKKIGNRLKQEEAQVTTTAESVAE